MFDIFVYIYTQKIYNYINGRWLIFMFRWHHYWAVLWGMEWGISRVFGFWSSGFQSHVVLLFANWFDEGQRHIHYRLGHELLQVLISAPSQWLESSLLWSLSAKSPHQILKHFLFGWWKFWPGRVCSSPESSAFVASKACWKLFSWYTQCLLPISGC